jgi:hypothetical protein
VIQRLADADGKRLGESFCRGDRLDNDSGQFFQSFTKRIGLGTGFAPTGTENSKQQKNGKPFSAHFASITPRTIDSS